MYHKLDESSGLVVGYSIDEKLTREEMQQLARELEKEIAATKGRIRVLLDVKAFPYGDWGAFWEDLKFDARHAKHIERCAVVGDRDWERPLVKVLGALTPTDTRYFDRSSIETAWHWLKAA